MLSLVENKPAQRNMVACYRWADAAIETIKNYLR